MTETPRMMSGGAGVLSADILVEGMFSESKSQVGAAGAVGCCSFNSLCGTPFST